MAPGPNALTTNAQHQSVRRVSADALVCSVRLGRGAASSDRNSGVTGSHAYGAGPQRTDNKRPAPIGPTGFRRRLGMLSQVRTRRGEFRSQVGRYKMLHGIENWTNIQITKTIRTQFGPLFSTKHRIESQIPPARSGG